MPEIKEISIQQRYLALLTLGCTQNMDKHTLHTPTNQNAYGLSWFLYFYSPFPIFNVFHITFIPILALGHYQIVLGLYYLMIMLF